MDARNANETRNRWAMGLRVATVVVVLGTLAAAGTRRSVDGVARRDGCIERNGGGRRPAPDTVGLLSGALPRA